MRARLLCLPKFKIPFARFGYLIRESSCCSHFLNWQVATPLALARALREGPIPGFRWRHLTIEANLILSCRAIFLLLIVMMNEK